MLPDNSTEKDDETVKRTHNAPIAKQGEEPDDHERTTTETLECIGTDKLDPSIGSIRKTQQGRNLNADTKPMLMNSSISKLNRDERSLSTDKKEYYDIKQADKDRESQEIPRHPTNNAANITWTDRHATKSKVPSKSIAAPIALTTTMISMYELSIMNTPIPNMTSLPETTQKPPETEITLGHTSFNLTVLAMVTVLTILSLDLRRYGSIACQLQEQLIWLHGVYSMNSLNFLARHPPRSLGLSPCQIRISVNP
jgi:hypothetical protein